ncbi:hypothetical protein AVEN_6334-1 [Araneus ventricosus]|uniref:Uncharacterized protein n=1 Tax=Araneus ventricosus TaxID=182803 RepID=A0A4Y2W7P8_ARAVE|nr:hypothetical protein AVEN_6334-1 [Araneus ventricosus]
MPWSKCVLLKVEQKFQIVSRIEAGETLAKLSKEFGVEVLIVGDSQAAILKRSRSFMQRPMANQLNCRKLLNGRIMKNWTTFITNGLFRKKSERVPISGIMIQQKALNFNSKLGGYKEFQASNG